MRWICGLRSRRDGIPSKKGWAIETRLRLPGFRLCRPFRPAQELTGRIERFRNRGAFAGGPKEPIPGTGYPGRKFADEPSAPILFAPLRLGVRQIPSGRGAHAKAQ